MLPKQIAYILFSVIALLSVLFGFSVYTNYTSKLRTEDEIDAVISKFEEKFKNDSIFLANENKLLIDKISQHIIDSVSMAYEKKLEIALLEVEKYKGILLANNIKHNNNLHSNTAIVDLQNKKEQLKLPIKAKSKLNITTVNSIKKHKKRTNFNITTYSKLPKDDNTHKKEPAFNVTTYSKIKKSIKKPTLVDNKSVKKPTLVNNKSVKNKHLIAVNNSKVKTIISSKNLKHNNYILDHSENLNDIDLAPIYKGCEIYKSEEELKNCFAVKVSKHIFNKFNSLKIQNSGLKKGMHKVRVLFIVDEHGNAKIGKLVGKWPNQIYKNIKFAVESIPHMKPGYANNKPVQVKYSLLIPFIIN